MHSNLKNLNQQANAHMVFHLWRSQRLAKFMFFGWFTEMVQCKGFVYGDRKNKAIQEVHRASIQHGRLMNCNIRNTRCHHYKQMWFVEVGAQNFFAWKKKSMYFNISILHNICLYSCCYKKLWGVCLFGGFFFIDEVVVVFANMDPNPTSWSSSYIKFVYFGIFSWNCCQFCKCRSKP